MSTDQHPQPAEQNDSPSPTPEKEQQAAVPVKTNPVNDFISLFKPAEGYFFTPVLLILNILVFVLMAVTGVSILDPDGASLVKWGANFRPVTLDGEWWRLITCCFLHIGIIHLLMNMYALMYIGVLLEPLLGKTRFIVAYLLAGLLASLTSLWWHDFTISAGASGAIFGMYGVFLALLTTNLIEKSARTSLLSSIGLFVGYNLLYGLKGGIDNAAHIGGLVSGLVIGYALIPSLKNPGNNKLTNGTLSGLTVLALAVSFFVYTKLPNDISLYDKKIVTFTELESKALNVYSMGSNTPTDTLLTAINKGLGYWGDNIKLLESLNTLKLPANLQQQNQVLKEYCNLRIRSYNMLYKAVSENSDQYSDSLEILNADIEKKVSELVKIRDGK
ncbi:MAG TPA: rhomboid family intramembrane serine protease [Chitinophagaceae bacterium]|nr:rhomboid family intramembrane serine protease [Chitinophagaceae bacterium]HPH30465.1 rhomboid family intramembrane serine protease [Chitinophagaceae bacterium]HPN57648.1 rhomboid family intramembrane serine protease [Chitinophagaceae bacterium]